MKLLLRIIWVLVLAAGLEIISIFLLAGTGDLPHAVLAQQLTSYFGSSGLWILLGGALVACSLFLRRLLHRLIQRRSDRQAQRILDDLMQSGEDPGRPFFLYLRAFETTGKLKAPWFIHAANLGTMAFRPYELEGFMAFALRKLGPLVALGQPGEHLGAGRVETTDDEWQGIVRRLVDQAQGILIIPSDRPGTLWEIQHLRSGGLLKKTIFVMPRGARGFDWRGRWQRAREAMGDFGAHLPEYDRHGLIFQLDDQGCLLDANHLPLWWAPGFRKAIKRFIADKPKLPAPPRRLARARSAAKRNWILGALNGLLRVGPLCFVIYAAATVTPALGPSGQPELWSTLWDRFMAAAEIQRLDETLGNRLLFNDQYRQLAADMSPAEETDLRWSLIERGLPWSGVVHIRAFFEAMAGLGGQLQPPQCRSLYKGNIADMDLNHAWVRVDPDVVRSRNQAYVAALEAGVIHPEPPEIGREKIVAAARLFVNSLQPADRQRYSQMADQPIEVLSDRDLCWLWTTLYQGQRNIPDDTLVAFYLAYEQDESLTQLASTVLSPLERLIQSPAYQARVDGLGENARIDVIVELMNAGLVRLDDKTLFEYYGIIREVVSRLGEDECVGVATGKLAADATSVFASLPEPLRQTWSNTLHTAAWLEVGGQPAPPLDATAAEAAADALIQALNPADAARVERMGVDPNSVSRDDLCWILRKKLDGVVFLESPHRQAWVRALIHGKF